MCRQPQTDTQGATDIYAANRQPGKEEIVEPEETIAYQPITCTVSLKYNCHGIPSSLARKSGKDARSSDLYSRAQVRPQHASPSHCGWSPSHTLPYLEESKSPKNLSQRLLRETTDPSHTHATMMVVVVVV